MERLTVHAGDWHLMADHLKVVVYVRAEESRTLREQGIADVPTWVRKLVKDNHQGDDGEMNYPEGLWPQDYCYMEGHAWGGGACSRCGERLRCVVCGQYMTVENCEEKHHHMPCSPDCEGCEECMAVRAGGGS